MLNYLSYFFIFLEYLFGMEDYLHENIKLFDILHAMPFAFVFVKIIKENNSFNSFVVNYNKTFKNEIVGHKEESLKDKNLKQLIPQLDYEISTSEKEYSQKNNQKSTRKIIFLCSKSLEYFEASFFSTQLNTYCIIFRKIEKGLSSGIEFEKNFNEIVLNQIPIGITVYDKNGQCVYANKASGKIIGASLQQVLDQNYNDLDSWKKTGLLNLTKEALKLNSIKEKTFFTTTSFGKNVWLHCIFIPIKKNNEIYLIMIYKDITLFKESELALEESEKIHRKYLQTSPIAVVMVNQFGQYIGVNKAGEKLTGYTLEELKVKTLFDLTHPESIEKSKKEFAEFVKTGKFNSEIKMIKKDGNIIDIKFKAVRVDDNHFIAFCEDVTEFNRIQKEIRNQNIQLESIVAQRTSDLKESEKKFETIFYSSLDLVVITDISGQFLEVNNSAEPELINKIENLFHLKNERIKSHNHIKILNYFVEINNMKSSYLEIPIQLPSKKLHIELQGKIIYYGKTKAIIHIIRDVTKKINSQQEKLKTIFETEERERNRFANDLHDSLSAILSAIKLQISVLDSRSLSQSDTAEIVKNCKDLISHASNTTREIANNIKPNELNDLGLIAALDNFCQHINIEGKLNVIFNANNVKCKINEEIELIIYRISYELINNTIKHANAKNIKLYLFNIQNKLILTYSDDGVGFEYKEILNKKNSGMGLNNMLSRIQSVNGSYEYKTSPGNGVNVTIEFNL